MFSKIKLYCFGNQALHIRFITHQNHILCTTSMCLSPQDMCLLSVMENIYNGNIMRYLSESLCDRSDFTSYSNVN